MTNEEHVAHIREKVGAGVARAKELQVLVKDPTISERAKHVQMWFEDVETRYIRSALRKENEQMQVLMWLAAAEQHYEVVLHMLEQIDDLVEKYTYDVVSIDVQ